MPDAPARSARAVPETARPCATPFDSIALLLQGGGALGAYQAGVYERLHEAGIEPTWVAGISIGAINSAIIAGNLPPACAAVEVDGEYYWDGTAFNELLAQMARELAASPQARMLAEAPGQAVYNIVQLVYRSPTCEGQSKDDEFSRRTMLDHWRAGYEQAGATLAHPDVLQLPPLAHSPAVFDFTHPTNKRPS